MTPDAPAVEYPHVATVHRPGLPDVHLGFHFAHQAELAAASLRGDFTNTVHVPGSTVTWSPTPAGVSVLAPLPSDRYNLAELIAAEADDQPYGHAFPDLFAQLKARRGYAEAVEIWRAACGVLDRDDCEADD